MMSDSNVNKSDTRTRDPLPDITWWMVLTSIVSIILIGFAWWYMVPSAYDGLMNDLFRPLVSGRPVVTVSSFYLTIPLLVFGLLAVFAMMVLILIARPLQLTQRRANEICKPFLWLGLIGAICGILAKPAAWGISTYLEGAGYHECEQHTRIDLFITTRTLVRAPGLCDEI